MANMNRFYLNLLVIVSAVAVVQGVGAQEVEWHTDYKSTIEEARATGKPIFLSMRCAPCTNARVFDARVTQTPIDSPRGQLLQQYVCARIISNTTMNIALFDRDWHNSVYYFILNADEQIYMRYGGRDERSAEVYLDYDSLELALQLGLQQHEKWKKGEIPSDPKPTPKYPAEFPLLKEEVIDAGRCVECHLMGDYRLLEKEQAGTLDKLTDMYVSPDIRTIGIALDVPKGLLVKEATGPVAAAGMQAGDLITAINGKPVLTFGDLQYNYNKVPRRDTKTISLTVQRGGESKEITVALPKEWWATNLDFRYWTIEPQAFFSTKPLSVEKRKELGLPKDGLSAEVVKVDPAAQVYNLHTLKVGDIVTAVNGVDHDSFTENLDIYIRLNVNSGAAFKVTVLRDGAASEMNVRTHREHFRKVEQ